MTAGTTGRRTTGRRTAPPRAGTWRNWAGNQRVRPAVVVRPQDAGEVAEAVTAAAAAGQRVTAVGSGHSFTAIAVAEDVQLDLSALSGLESADRRTGLVTVGAGTPLYLLNRLLDQLGLGLSNLGDIDRQTVAGALATGTHGTGRALGGLATQVRGLELVLADGSAVSCSATERPELFSAARVGLGALGVVTSVTLQAEPAFVLHAQERPMPYARVVEELDDLVAANDHFEFFWFPHTERTLTKRNNRVPGGTVRPLPPVRTFLEDEVVGNTVHGLACRLGRARPAWVPRINGAMAQLLGDREYTDVSHRVFVSTRRVRFLEMEYAVPAAAVREALAGIRRAVDVGGFRVSFPVEVRFTAGDDVPLSTAHGRDTAYLAVHMAVGEPYQGYFDAVEQVMGALDGRPHWGKLHSLDAAALRTRYPRFDDFLAVRDACDPEGRFANAHLDRVLGPPGS